VETRLNLMLDHLQLDGVHPPQQGEVEVQRAIGVVEVAQGHAVWPSDGRLAAGEGHIGQVGDALVLSVVADQEFAAPDAPVLAVARAVEGHADDAPLQAVLGHTTGDVGVVVLHSDKRLSAAASRRPSVRPSPLAHCLLLGIFCRKIIGMHVVSDDPWIHLEEPLEVLDGGFVGPQGLQVLHVADVLAQEGVGVFGEAEGVLELGPAGQYLLKLEGKPHGEGGVAP